MESSSFFKAKIISTSGRTMLEMLGVLAVIGILSGLALFGYNIAMTYHRANETIHDVMIRGTNVPMIWEDYATYLDPHEFDFSELGNTFKTTNALGYPVKTYAEPDSSNYIFRVEVSNVPKKVCERLLNMRPTSIDLIEAPADLYKRGTSNSVESACTEDFGKMSFYFDEDWSNNPPVPPVPPSGDCKCDEVGAQPACSVEGTKIITCSNGTTKTCPTYISKTKRKGICCNEDCCPLTETCSDTCTAQTCADVVGVVPAGQEACYTATSETICLSSCTAGYVKNQCASCVGVVIGKDECGCDICQSEDCPAPVNVSACQSLESYTYNGLICYEYVNKITKKDTTECCDGTTTQDCCPLNGNDCSCTVDNGLCPVLGEAPSACWEAEDFTYTGSSTCPQGITCRRWVNKCPCQTDGECGDGFCCRNEGCTSDCSCTTDSECGTGACCGENGCESPCSESCRTCEQVGCTGSDCCVMDKDNCATGCTNGECPDGFGRVDSMGACACMPAICGENSNGQSGAQSSYVCCSITFMEDMCGESDSPSNHIWVGDIFGKGDGTNNYCCCTEDDSEACCQASKGENYHLIDGDCVEFTGCIYSYTNPEGRIGSDCSYTYTNPVGDIRADCSVTGYQNPTGAVQATCSTSYTNPEEHCYWTDDNGNQQDSTAQGGCKRYSCTEYYKCTDGSGNETMCSRPYTKDGGSACRPNTDSRDKNGVGSICSCDQWYHEKTGPGVSNGCKSGQYCNFRYTAENCTGSLGATGAPTMYGVCNDMDKTDWSCEQTIHLPSLNVSTCGTDKYCRIAWTSNDCSGNLGAEGAATMYGVCSKMDSNNASCPQGVNLDSTYLQVEKGCPADRYCRISWTSDTCSGSLGATGAAKMYGVCSVMTSNSTSCPQAVHLDSSYLSPTAKCPAGKYCRLSWSSQDCSSGLGATGSNPMYGACLDFTSTSGVCPSTL